MFSALGLTTLHFDCLAWGLANFRIDWREWNQLNQQFQTYAITLGTGDTGGGVGGLTAGGCKASTLGTGGGVSG